MSKYNGHPAHVELAKVLGSVRLLGPPMSQKFVELIAHLFSPEEAEIAVHLPFYYPKSLKKIAKRARRVPELIEPLLKKMSDRRVIYGGEKGYSLLPLVPGMFEYMLISGVDTDWHRQFAHMFNELYSTGYMKDYNAKSLPSIRSIPVQKAIEGKSMVVDADLISEMIDAHTDMAVANVCQCRQSLHFDGKECARSTPQDGCLIFGSFAEGSIESGDARRVSREEMRDVVTERWEKNLVFFTGNITPNNANAICTCCDCCCHALETINHYNGKVVLAPPHYIAKVDEDLCNDCGKCVRACNTYAHTLKEKKHLYDSEKCIGCSLCVTSCKPKAITMAVNPAYKHPSKSLGTLGLKLLPGSAMTMIKTRLGR